MDIRLLKSFLMLAEQGQFGRAAMLLHMTQSTLSKQIVMLEGQVGGRLFERGKHGAALSALGRLFWPEAQQLVRDADRLLQRVRQASQGERGRLRLGFGLSTLRLAPRWVAWFRQRFPAVDVSLNDLSSQEQYLRLGSGELELGFVRRPPASVLEFLPLMVEQLTLSVPAQSAWQGVPDDLARLNVDGFVALAQARGPGLAAQVEQWCQAHRFVPRVVQEADDTHTVQALVAAGIGLALLPVSAQWLLPGAIRSLPLAGQAAQWEVGLAWHPGKLSPAGGGGG
ncbi:LysR family transcriptional regulator, partial [Rugamonas sp. CCM 8940]|uniref:LysR family transcriptional regulator n=1 Tax=Rugamonas sp. CCM 8940 TaxID=2765359 RepID=UPI0018F2D02E